MKLRFLYSIDNEFIPLSNVESINSSQSIQSIEDRVVDKLKGDYIIRIRTLSNREYICSMNQIIKTLGSEYKGNAESFFRDVVIESWLATCG